MIEMTTLEKWKRLSSYKKTSLEDYGISIDLGELLAVPEIKAELKQWLPQHVIDVAEQSASEGCEERSDDEPGRVSDDKA